MQEALIGLAGLLIGMLFTEHFRKRSRIESFSAPIFEKRLSVYEELMKEFHLAYGVIEALHEDTDSTLEEKYEISFANGLKLIQFAEDSSLYINEEVTVHISMLFIGANDIFNQESSEEERKEAHKQFKLNYGETKNVIRSASGVATIDNLITNITKSKPESEFIAYFRKVKNEYEQKKSI